MQGKLFTFCQVYYIIASVRKNAKYFKKAYYVRNENSFGRGPKVLYSNPLL